MMDTIELTTTSPELAESIVRGVLHRATAAKAKNWHGKYQNVRGRSLAFLPGFRQFSPGVFEGKFVMAASSLAFRDQAAFTMISFHLTAFVSITEVVLWLSRLTNLDLAQLRELRVRRIDACIDLSVPFDTLRRVLDVPKVHTFKLFGNRNGRTIYFGADCGQQIYCYECLGRAGQPDWALDSYGMKCLDAFSRIEIRLESRFRRNKCPVDTFGDLVDAKFFAPFEHLSVTEVDGVQIVNAPPEKRQALESFQWLVLVLGFAEARREINKRGRNFERDIRPYLHASTVIDFNQAWATRFSRFFEMPGSEFSPREEHTHG